MIIFKTKMENNSINDSENIQIFEKDGNSLIYNFENKTNKNKNLEEIQSTINKDEDSNMNIINLNSNINLAYPQHLNPHSESMKNMISY